METYIDGRGMPWEYDAAEIESIIIDWADAKAERIATSLESSRNSVYPYINTTKRRSKFESLRSRRTGDFFALMNRNGEDAVNQLGEMLAETQTARRGTSSIYRRARRASSDLVDQRVRDGELGLAVTTTLATSSPAFRF